MLNSLYNGIPKFLEIMKLVAIAFGYSSNIFIFIFTFSTLQ